MKSTFLAGIAIVIVVIAVSALFLYTSSKQSGNVLLSLTDPANVPFGTQSLNITYSGLAVHTTNSNTSSWINLSNSGTVDLLSLVNSSLTLGVLSLLNGTKINLVQFNVSSANIEINNTIYKVTLPNSKIIAHINGLGTVNGTVRVLMDLSPTVITVVTANSTLFIMVPSIRAVIVPHPINVQITPGVEIPLHEQDKAELADITPNISITSASLSNLNNVTSLHVTVKDNSNVSVILRQVIIFGNQSINLPKYNITNVNGENKGNVSSHIIITPSDLSVNSTVVPNKTINENGGINETEIEKEVENLGKTLAFMRTVTLLAGANGSLYLPFLKCSPATGNGGEDIGSSPAKSVCPENVNYSGFNKGYTLNANQTATLSFAGSLITGEGNYQINIIPGDAYTLVVQGENGGKAHINVTAS